MMLESKDADPGEGCDLWPNIPDAKCNSGESDLSQIDPHLRLWLYVFLPPTKILPVPSSHSP